MVSYQRQWSFAQCSSIHRSLIPEQTRVESWIPLQKINHLISDITHCLLQATKWTHLMVRIPTHANQETLWSTLITKSSIGTFFILLHGYTVHYSRVSLSPMPIFFLQIFVKATLVLLRFDLELCGLVALWSKRQILIADCTCSQNFFPFLLYTIRFVSEFSIRCTI